MTPVLTRPDPPGRSRRAVAIRRWTIVLSVLGHLVLLMALLFALPPREELIAPEPSYQLVFDNGGSPDRSTSPEEAEEKPPAEPQPPAAEAPSPSPLPSPEPAAESPPATAPAPRPEPMPQPEPVPQPEPPAPAEPAPVMEAPAAPAPDELAPAPTVPQVRLEAPPALTPGITPQSLAPDLTLVTPPPLPVLPPGPPRPVQQAQRRPAPDPNRFPNPIDLDYGQGSSRVPAYPRGSVASRSIDLSPGAARAGPNKSEAFFDARAAKIGADWANGLAAYWRAHRYYPRQAVENGEDGSVQVELVVNRLGRVESVQIKTRSGSPWLDMAALGTWRNAQLAPFPRENTDDRATITLTINYILIR